MEYYLLCTTGLAWEIQKGKGKPIPTFVELKMGKGNDKNVNNFKSNNNKIQSAISVRKERKCDETESIWVGTNFLG